MNDIAFNIKSASSSKNFDNKSEIVDRMKRHSLYWISQLSGWGLFVIVNVAIISSLEAITIKKVFLWILLGILGVIFTHLYRNYIRKNNWANLPLKKIIPRVLIASFIVGILIFTTIYLSGYFIQVEKEYHHLIASIIAEIETLIFEAAVKDFELKTLKAQLNPHFMFNAMNSIRALIEEDPQNAKDAITKLSNLMRYTLKIERSETVPLGEELRTIQDYLDLEKIRFEERLSYKIQSTSEADRVEIPPMMVQTLVENGIKHGISKITSGGELFVDAKTESSKLLIEIRNTGNFNQDALKNSHGFGVSNTKHRLSLLYGENASLTLSNENQNTVLAKLSIPLGG
jgi:two-component system LytT family sensor kinase